MKQIQAWLDSRIGLNFRSGLDRITAAVTQLNHPENAYPIIHVTGTNGKGSTIAFMQKLFERHHKRVGTFTSPHLVTVRDRICIDGIAIVEEDFVRLAKDIQELERTHFSNQVQLSYFEILTLLAFLYFREQKVDVALIEVGIGGLLDTTNIVTSEIAVVTSIGLDHQETLGTSLSEIAQQKAGIFKKNKTAIIGPVSSEVRLIMEKQAEQLDVELYEYGRDFFFLNAQFSTKEFVLPDVSIGLSGDYQKENAALALQALLLLMEKQGWELDTQEIYHALATTRWAGRLEMLAPNVYLDGAHNLPALTRLVEFIDQQKEKKISLLFGALKRKPYREMLGYLQEKLPDVAIYVTTFEDMGALTHEDISDVPFVPSYASFIQDFLKEKRTDQLLFVTGSLYFISEVRELLLSKKLDI